jgi:hypothetical protein
MWLIAVAAFYYRMRMSLNIATAVEEEQYARNLKAMGMHVDFGKQMLAFPKVNPGARIEALLAKSALDSTAGMLREAPNWNTRRRTDLRL